jgi:hypothetical protein
MDGSGHQVFADAASPRIKTVIGDTRDDRPMGRIWGLSRVGSAPCPNAHEPLFAEVDLNGRAYPHAQRNSCYDSTGTSIDCSRPTGRHRCTVGSRLGKGAHRGKFCDEPARMD